MSDLPWQAALILVLGGLLIAGGVIAFLRQQFHDEKQRRRLGRYRVGEDSRSSIITWNNIRGHR